MVIIYEKIVHGERGQAWQRGWACMANGLIPKFSL